MFKKFEKIDIITSYEQPNKMSSEAGSTQCRGLIEAKESLIKAMNSLGAIDKTDHIQRTLRDIYNELEILHESRRIKESNNLNWIPIQTKWFIRTKQKQE